MRTCGSSRCPACRTPPTPPRRGPTSSRACAASWRGARKFEDVAKRESSDTVSGQKGRARLDQAQPSRRSIRSFIKGLRGLKPGQVSAPGRHRSFGYHLIRIDQEKGDSVKLRHILIPVGLQGAHLDQVEARADHARASCRRAFGPDRAGQPRRAGSGCRCRRPTRSRGDRLRAANDSRSRRSVKPPVR